MPETANRGANQGDKPEGDTNGLGIAGGMAKAFIHSPLSPLLLLAALALGILGLVITPRQEDPQISVPMVDVFFAYPGATADQVASLAIDPLERMMSEISGVKHVYSVSQRGEGMVTVEFDVGQNMETSLVKLYDRLNSNMDKMPPGVTPPMVKPKGVDDVPVVTLSLWSQDVGDEQLRLIGLDVIQRLKEVKDTSQSFIVGGRSEELRIEVYPERLKGYGIVLDQLAETVRNANSERGMGHVESGDTSYRVYTGAFLTKASDVERLVVGVRNGSPVYIRDVAEVTEAPSDFTNVVTYYTGLAAPKDGVQAPGGASAITVAIAKKRGSNGVTVANAVIDKVNYLKGRLIPDNVQVSVTRDYGTTANDKVNELVFKLFEATFFVTLLIWWALGFRAAIVVLVVIPVVILVTVFSAWLMGYTIDRVSLFALIFSIGILVDDAIVVVENIYRRWLEKGDTDTETSVDAVREVGNPTIIATLTVIAALMPMGFVSGMMGPYMEPISALGSSAMIFSLFAAFIFTPWLAMRIRPSMALLQQSQEKEHRQMQRLDGVFRRLLLPLLDSRIKGLTFTAALVVLFVGSISLFYTTDVAVKMLPFDNKSEFNVVVNMPEGTALPATANVVHRLSEELLKIPEAISVQTYAGTASPFNFNGLVRHYYLRQLPWYGDIQVQLQDKGNRKRTSHQIASAAREVLAPIVKAMGGKIVVVEMPPGPPVLETVVAEIYGPDAETRRQTARDLTTMFERAPDLVDVDNLMQDPYEIWRFDIDREKAVRNGVSVEDINRQLEMALGGQKLGDIKLGHVLEPRYIVLQVPMALRSQFSRLGEIPVPSSGGLTIPLAELGRFERSTQDPIIYHKDLRAVEFVVGDVAGRLGAPIYGMLNVEKELVNYTSPDGIKVDTHYLAPPADGSRTSLEWTGEWTVTYETFRDMGIAFAAAMVLIYMLVVWEFGNFTLPAIIMAPIPLTLIGIIPGHWLFGAEFTATSMIGFIALSGIIVRNSILLVDFVKQGVDMDMSVREAVIRSCRTRFRPIGITVLALVAGSVVILSDPIFQGMAISLLAGGAVSTLLTLVIIPLGCVVAEKSFHPPSHKEDGVVASVRKPAAAAMTGASAAAMTGASAGAKAKMGTASAKLSVPVSVGPSLITRIRSLAAVIFGILRMVVYFAGLALKDVSSRLKSHAKSAEAPLPAAKPVVKAPVVKAAVKPSVTKPVAASTVAKSTVTAPVAKSTMAAPVEETIVVAPVEQTVATAPVEETIVVAPVEQTVATAPVGETIVVAPVEQTVATAPVEEAIVVVPVEQTVATAPVEETIVVAPVEQTVATAPVEETIVVVPVEQTIATAPVEETVETHPEANTPLSGQETTDEKASANLDDVAVHNENSSASPTNRRPRRGIRLKTTPTPTT